MNDERFVNCLELTNFRCLPDGHIGPFATFNLIYGRNGSGKTSLLEALELAFTGRSYRIRKKDKAQSVLARERRNEIVVNAVGIENTIASFVGGSHRPTASKLLRSLYGIKADGRKARFLTRQFFTTHNILYAERVIRFLEAEEKSQLNSVLSEITVGREILERWSYIEESRRSIDAILDEYSSRIALVNSEISADEENLRTILAENQEHVLAQAEEVRKALPLPVSRLYPKDFTISVHTTEDLYNLKALLKELVDRAYAIRLFFDAHEYPDTWGAFTDQIEGALKARDDSEAEKAAISGRLGTVSKKRIAYENSEKEISRRLTILQDEESTLNKLTESLYRILNWLPELCAQKKAESLVNGIRARQVKMRALERAFQVIEGLPSSEELSRLGEEINWLKLEQIETQEVLKRIQHQRKELGAELERIERKLDAVQESHDRLTALLVQLHHLAEEFITLRPGAACPTCGHVWTSKKALRDAMQERQEFVQAELHKGADLVSEDARAKVELGSSLATLVKEESSAKDKLQECSDRLKECELRQNAVQVKWDEMVLLLKEQGLLRPAEEEISPDQLANLNLETLKQELRSTQKTLTKAESEHNRIWAGLRRELFEKEKPDLMSQMDSLRLILSEYELRPPSQWDPAAWKSILQEVREKIAVLNKAHQDKERVLSRIRRGAKEFKVLEDRLSREKAEAEEKNRLATDQVEKLTGVQGHIEVLRDHGFIEIASSVDMDRLHPQLQQLLRQVGALSERLGSMLRMQQEHSILRKRLQDRKAELKELNARLKIAHNLEERLENVLPLTKIQMAKWKQYDEIISLLFKKLHWPFDFRRVRLRARGDELDLEVESRREPNEWTAAHQRLSSGQRSALALSVFWAFNVLPETITPLLMMDEPIQNIDELNTLNFLDGLRWLIEAENRQVFLTTASQRVAGFIRRKFSYLGNGFLELRLARDSSVSAIEYRDAKGALMKPEKMPMAYS